MAKDMETKVKITGQVDKSLQKTLNDTADKMDKLQSAAKSAAGPAARLANQISKQEDVLRKAQKEYTNYVLSNEESSDAAKRLARQIEDTSRALNKNKSALDKAEKAAEDLGSGYSGIGGKLKKMKDSMSDTGGFSIMKGAIANLASQGIQFLIGKIGEAISWLGSLAEETQEYREDMGKLETAYESAGLTSDMATKQYKEFYEVLGEEDRSVEAVNHLAKFVDTEEDMAKWTTIATGVWGQYGDSLPIEGLTEAANETAKVGQITGPMADAINWATTSNEDWEKALSSNKDALKAFQTGIAEGESAEDAYNRALASCNTEQERAALLTDSLNSLYSESAGKYRENNESIMAARAATSAYTDAQAALGEQMEPVKTKLTEMKTQLLVALTPAISAAAGALTKVLGGALSAVTWAIEKAGNMIDWLSGKAAKLAEIRSNVTTGANKVVDIAKNVKIPKLATGGFTSGVSIAGEAGTEAVISFNPAYRSDNLSYWAQAGRMLGATSEDADFAIGGTGGNSTSINLGGMTYNPEINISGNADYNDIMRALRDSKAEFEDMLYEILGEREALTYA